MLMGTTCMRATMVARVHAYFTVNIELLSLCHLCRTEHLRTAAVVELVPALRRVWALDARAQPAPRNTCRWGSYGLLPAMPLRPAWYGRRWRFGSSE